MDATDIIELRANYIKAARARGYEVGLALGNLPSDNDLKFYAGGRGGRYKPDAEAERDFWSEVDRSGGPDDCHLWTGRRHWNHHEDHVERFEQGKYSGSETRFGTRITSRIAVVLAYGHYLTKTVDVHPRCGNHLCCNVRHFSITPHGGPLWQRLEYAIPVEEYFCV